MTGFHEDEGGSIEVNGATGRMKVEDTAGTVVRGVVYFEAFGAFFGVLDGTLMVMAALESGYPALADRWGECCVAQYSRGPVEGTQAGEVMDSLRFCDAVNAVFGTDFIPSDFPGR